jgi:ATP-dependent metalloprotease FtsH
MKKNMNFKNFKKNPRTFLLYFFLGIIGLFILTRLTDYARMTQVLPYSEFMKKVELDQVKNIYVDKQQAQGILKDGTHYETVLLDTPKTWETLREHNVSVSLASPVQQISLWHILFMSLLVLLAVGVWVYFRQGRSGGGGGSNVFNMGKSRAKMFLPSQINVNFKSIAGAQEAKEGLQDIVDFLKNPEKYRRIGAKLPRGVLLVGEPGNGKTLLAKALAGEANCPFFSISGSDFIEVFVGVGAARIRDLFAQARKHAPSIIFIDEIDAVGRHRGIGMGGGNDEREQTLNQLLTEMDGFDVTGSPVVVIAATNIPEVLDKALLRPGRFDRRITVPYPDIAAREQILKLHTQSTRIAPDVDLGAIAGETAGFTGADLANLVNQAAINASKRGREIIAREDFTVAHTQILSSRTTEGSAGSAKGQSAMFMPTQVKTKFSDVAGAVEAKEELQDVVDFLKTPDKFTRLGAKIPRGVLLVGDPGNGKTLLAKAVAGEAGRPFFSTSGSDFVEKYVGVGASRIRELFVQARKHAPSIVFIDEIDAVGRRRSGDDSGGTQEHDQTLNQLLTEMDGFSTVRAAVIVIAATNRVDVLDKALLRAGRFDRQVNVPYPDLVSREAILQVHARDVKLDPTVDLQKIARGTPGFTGAALENLINEAAIFASKKEQDTVTMVDFEEARDKAMLGKEMKTIKMSPEELRMTAFHEAGHALVRLLIPEETEPLHKVTIIPRGMALGVTHWLPEREKYSTSKEEMLASVMSALGGRAAEELVFHKLSTGAYSDFQAATSMARKMVCSYGMSEKLGPMVYDGGGHSPETARLIDIEIRAIIEDCHKKTLDLLAQNRKMLDTLAEELLAKETLYADDIYPLLGIAPRVTHKIS